MNDPDFAWMDDVVKEVTLERAKQLGMSADLISRLEVVAGKSDIPYLFRTTLLGGFSGEPGDDGTTTVSHIGSLDSYLIHMVGWLESHTIVNVEIRRAAYSGRKFRPVFDSELITLEDGTKIAGVGVDLKADDVATVDKDGKPTKAEDNPRRRYHELRVKNPAEAERYWRRVKAAVKGWETRKNSPKAKAQKKRAVASNKKYKALLKTDKAAAERYKKRSAAAKKAAKTRGKKAKKK